MPTSRDIHEVENLRELYDVRECASYAIQSQYSASQRMLALMAGFQEQITIDGDADLFYQKMFNIYTAVGYGLDNWGRILGITRTIEDADTGAALTLEDEYYRALLLYKALANIAAADAQTLNSLLRILIETGIAGFPPVAYVLEVDTMVIRWVFEDFLDPIQRAVFFAAGTLARGAGVGWELYAINPAQVFGFDGSGMHPFNQAPFAPDDSLVKG
ncbi:MAG: DUF2612 domain-containing protein [Planctomycetes bacterium]|nr:DUF2612 domain-containing protein [Planctomycetota bacterium]